MKSETNYRSVGQMIAAGIIEAVLTRAIVLIVIDASGADHPSSLPKRHQSHRHLRHRPARRRGDHHRGRRPLPQRTKARFAMANGTAPIAASSGRVVRHRLNSGGNRQLNRALHLAALAQIRSPDTEDDAYYQRCLQRSKTKREATRTPKRRISDRIRTHLQHTNPTSPLT